METPGLPECYLSIIPESFVLEVTNNALKSHRHAETHDLLVVSFPQGDPGG